jgi:hypothetical protein
MLTMRLSITQSPAPATATTAKRNEQLLLM